MKYYIIIFLFFLTCCTSEKEISDNNIEKIPVYTENITENASQFIERIEAVSLECDDTLSLIKGYRKLIYDDVSNLYAILDERFIVLLFSAEGKFIASSESKQGDGPDQYQMIVDIKFNPFDKGIDLLNPYGIIYTYDYNFNLLNKRDFRQAELSFNNFIAYDKQKYLFTPSLLMDDSSVYWIDNDDKKMEKENYNGTISSINMDRESFYKLDSTYYFIPTGINYYFYKIDMSTHHLTPYIKLDFGKEEIQEKKLPGEVKANLSNQNKQKEQIDFIRQLQERNNYLENSSCILPLIKFFNNKYVYVHYIKNRHPSNYIYNRKTHTGFLQNGEKPLKMPFCFAINNSILYSVIDAVSIEEYINKEFMSKETIEQLKNIKEDDNPVILKYYLR